MSKDKFAEKVPQSETPEVVVTEDAASKKPMKCVFVSDGVYKYEQE